MSNENNNNDDAEAAKVVTMLTTSEVKTIETALGEEYCNGLKGMMPEALNQQIVTSTVSKQSMSNDLKANLKYQQIKADKSYLENGLKDAKKRQDQIIKYCLHLLEGKGKV